MEFLEDYGSRSLERHWQLYTLRQDPIAIQWVLDDGLNPKPEQLRCGLCNLFEESFNPMVNQGFVHPDSIEIHETDRLLIATDIILEQNPDLVTPIKSGKYIDWDTPADRIICRSIGPVHEAYIEAAAHVVLATIEQHINKTKKAYTIGFNSIFDGIGDTKDRKITMNNIAVIHDRVREMLTNEETEKAEILMNNHENKLSYWLSSLKRPSINSLPKPLTDFEHLCCK